MPETTDLIILSAAPLAPVDTLTQDAVAYAQASSTSPVSIPTYHSLAAERGALGGVLFLIYEVYW